MALEHTVFTALCVAVCNLLLFEETHRKLDCRDDASSLHYISIQQHGIDFAY